jgi:DNA-binding transcriptional LysR family regulator
MLTESLLPVVVKGIVTQPVSLEPLRAVLPVSHELASRSEVSLHQLCDMPLICIGRQHHPKFYKQLHEICLRHGLDAVANQDVTTFSEAAPMVAEGLGFTFARAWHERHSYSGVVFRAIKGCPLSVDSALAFRLVSPSGVLDRLIVALGERELARTDVPMPGHDSQVKAS